MKKKIIALMLIAAMVTVACACGKADSTDSPDTEAASSAVSEDRVSAPEEGTQAIEVDDGLIMTEITFSSVFMNNEDGEPMTQEEVDEWAKGSFTSGTLNEDGSVTVKMTKKQKETALHDYMEYIAEDIQKYLADSGEDESVESFTCIGYTESMSEIWVEVDPAKYTDWDFFNTLPFLMYGGYYQMLEGKAAEELNTTVYIKDQDTKEVMKSISIQELLNPVETE